MIHGYIRVSTSEQARDDRTSLADQERRIRAIAQLRDEHDPPIYRDEGVSGTVPLDKRPGGAVLLAAVQPGDLVVAAKLDRIFRSARDALTQAEELHARKVDIILVDGGTEPIMSSATGKLFFSMLASFAEFERQRIRERINDGKTGKQRNGGFTGGHAPFGFEVVGIGREAKLAANAKEQHALATAKRLASDGAGYTAVAAELNRQGFRSRRNTLLTATQVWRWLKTPHSAART